MCIGTPKRNTKSKRSHPPPIRVAVRGEATIKPVATMPFHRRTWVDGDQRAKRASLMEDINFVKDLKARLAPPKKEEKPPPGPSETEIKLLQELGSVQAALKKREEEETMSKAIFKARKEGEENAKREMQMQREELKNRGGVEMAGQHGGGVGWGQGVGAGMKMQHGPTVAPVFVPVPVPGHAFGNAVHEGVWRYEEAGRHDIPNPNANQSAQRRRSSASELAIAALKRLASGSERHEERLQGLEWKARNIEREGEALYGLVQRLDRNFGLVEREFGRVDRVERKLGMMARDGEMERDWRGGFGYGGERFGGWR